MSDFFKSMGIFWSIILQFSCTPDVVEFPYDLQHPSQTYALPKKLKEVSGVVHAGGDKLYCVDDETGKIFVFGMAAKEIEMEIPFAKKGDFEDIAVCEKVIFVLTSKGKLYRIAGHTEKDPAISEFSMDVGKDCNAEGLVYNIFTGQLLVACKGKSKEKRKAIKRIYTFDPKTNKVSDSEMYSLSLSDIHDPKRWISEKRFAERRSQRKAINSYNPSGIAIQPATGSLFILSSVGKSLLVLDKHGLIENLLALDPALFKQPEGITFDNENTLYISNEGRGKQATILVFPISNVR